MQDEKHDQFWLPMAKIEGSRPDEVPEISQFT